MLSKAAATKKLGIRDGFNWRGEEISRIEGLSDAVFAFAVTLLIVSLEVPRTFDDLLFGLRGFGAFAACFAQLMIVWYNQYIYFRRYNLQDVTSIILTMTLLLFVLFYTYPLKFVFTAWLAPARPGAPQMLTSLSQVQQLFQVYAIGFIAVFSIFVLMYLHAYRHRENLKLTELEIWDTKHSMREMVLYGFVGVCSLVLTFTLPEELVGLSGTAYASIGLLIWAHESWSAKRRKHIEARHMQAITFEMSA